LHGRVVDLQPDAVRRDVVMLAVFTIIGLNASAMRRDFDGAVIATGFCGFMLANLVR
jgi:hypothetical protein